MIDNIHRWLTQRLLLVWLILSLAIGGLVQYLGHTRLDSHVVTMAQAETSNYTAGFIDYLRSPSEQALARFNRTIHTLIEEDNLAEGRQADR